LTSWWIAALAAMVSVCAHADEAARWRAVEDQARGDFPRLLEVAGNAPQHPHWREQRPVDELVQVLDRAGRFVQLGVSRAQGRELVLAYYRRQGLDEQGRSPAVARPAGGAATSALPAPPPGYRAGREFDPLQAVLLRWPFDWAALRDEYAVLVQTIVAAGAEARVWVDTARQQQAAARYLRGRGIDLARVSWKVESTDSVWLRDYGPNYVYGPGADDWAVVDFHYYGSRPADDDTPLVVAAMGGKPVIDRQVADAVFTEGGNINTDGLGTVLYSARTYSKNKGVPRATIDTRIRTALNAPNGIVLEDPSLDATGHVDMFSKIVATDTVLIAQYDADEVDHAVLEANAALLASRTNGAGQPWKVLRIRQPDVYYEALVNPVIRTYTNGLVVNSHVIVPVYGIADDAAALALYQAIYPNKTIVPLNATAIIASAGAWHCVTMEFVQPGTP
jgi:agmatine deiminase